MNREELNKIGHYIEVYKRLQKIEKSLHKLYETACNQEMTKRQIARQDNLRKKADELALNIGLKAYHQTDCRGCSIYLISDDLDETTYNNGIAVY